MTIDVDPKPCRGRAILKSVVALTIVAGLTMLVTSAFRLGMNTGFAAAIGAFVVYSVPATIFDWPRLTWEDIMSALGALASAIGAFIRALFDW